MKNIHKVIKVVNNQVIINLPSGFADREVEVFLKSPAHKNSDIRNLEKEIDIGMRSPASPRSHREIFNNLRKKHESC